MPTSEAVAMLEYLNSRVLAKPEAIGNRMPGEVNRYVLRWRTREILYIVDRTARTVTLNRVRPFPDEEA